MASESRLLSLLSVPVLRAVAKRMGVEGADDMDRGDLVAALVRAPSRRAIAAGQSVRRLVSRLPASLLGGVRGWIHSPARFGDGAPRPPAVEAAGVARAGPAETPPVGGEIDFETVSMADLLIRQGYEDRAAETLERILARQPDNSEARARLDRLRAGERSPAPAARRVPPPPAPAEPAPAGPHSARVDEPLFRPFSEPPPEPFAPLDFQEPPAGYGRVYAGLLPVDTTTVYAYWETTREAVEGARSRLGDRDARLTLRLASHHPDAPAGGDIRDVEVDEHIGEYFFVDLRPAAHHRLAVGLRAASGAFEPLCHTGATSTPRKGPSGDLREVWLEVEPPGDRRGPTPEMIRVIQRVDGSAADALEGRLRRIGLAGLPEGVRARLLARFRDMLRTLWGVDLRGPGSPAGPGWSGTPPSA